MEHLQERVALRAYLDSRKPISFRAFLESPSYAAPYLHGRPISPVTWAIVDASEGTPVTTIDDALSQRIFHCPAARLPVGRIPKKVVVGAGRRGGKTSRLVATKAVHAAWTVPLPDLAPGQVASSVLIAPRRKYAEEAFRYVLGVIDSSPVLKAAVVRRTADTIVMRRPDEKLCDVTVAAADSRGASGRSRTLVFAAMDEACFFRDANYATNDRDIYDGLLPALIEAGPRAQIWITSTPWVEGEGLMEALISQEWGKHVGALVAARVSTDLLRPNFDMDSARQELDPEVFEREILAIPLEAGFSAFFPGPSIKAALERMPPAGQAEEAAAGMDLGHVHDHSALAIASRFVGGMFAATYLLEILSNPHQPPSKTYAAFADALLRHKQRTVCADSAFKPNVVEVLRQHGITFVNATSDKTSTYQGMRALLTENRLCLGALEETMREALGEQLASIVAKPLAGGRIQISAPRTKGDPLSASSGGHADSVSALVLALFRVGSCDPSTWRHKPDIWRPKAKTGRFGGHSSHDPYGRGGYNRDDYR